jgi:hypothetical protein
MTKIHFAVMLALILSGCNNDRTEEQALSKSSSSCLVEDAGGIIICFEGDLESVKSKCTDRNSKKKNHMKVTFSETKGCPRDQGYVGYCIMDGGSYIPYDYIDPSLNISKRNKNMMKEMYKKDCLDFRGEWME